MMDPNPPAAPIEVVSIGSAALAGLVRAGRGTVLASVSRALYVHAAENDLYWIMGTDSPMHRRCVQVSSPLPKALPGEILELRDWLLDGRSLGLLDPGHPGVWKEPVLPVPDLALDDLPGRTADLYHDYLQEHKPAGWGSLIPLILNTFRQKNDILVLVPQPDIPAVVWLIIERMLVALRENDPRLLPGLALQLVGMGEGLTPSGDDFLGGLFFCLHILRQAYPGRQEPAWNYLELIEQFAARTNRISFTFLGEHARGHTLEPLHLFASGLLAGVSHERLFVCVEELLRVGHSTGWDLWTGFLAGMSTVRIKLP